MTRVLCLHGCRQSKDVFESILKPLVKMSEKYDVNFYFIEGMYDCIDHGKTWYNKPLIIEDIGKINYDPELIKECMAQVDQFIIENNITVLLGFSQGGNVIDAYLRSDCLGRMKIEKAVIISGYSFIYPDVDLLLDTPLLSIFSPMDEIVRPEFKPVLYKNIEEIEHDKGHKIPTRKPILRRICEFLSKV